MYVVTLPRYMRDRLHKLVGFIVTAASLAAFFAVVWPPGILLVSASIGLVYTYERNTG